jgi:hypothetical protein
LLDDDEGTSFFTESFQTGVINEERVSGHSFKVSAKEPSSDTIFCEDQVRNLPISTRN